MIKGSLNQRYAKALFEIAAEKKQIAEYGKQLRDFSALLEQSPEVSRLVLGKLISASEKKKLVMQILGEDAAEDVKKFLFLLIDKSREKSLADMVDAYDELCDQAAGIKSVLVTTAVPLAEPEAQALQKALSDRLGKQVRLKTELNKDLIGGLTVQIDDVVYDASIARQLFALKQSLVAEA